MAWKNKRMGFVYVLQEPDTQEVRYVGQSQSPTNRLKSHLDGSRTDTSAKGAWIRTLLASGKQPGFEVIDQIYGTDIDRLEMAWIWYYALKNKNLLNAKVYPPDVDFLHIKYPDVDRNTMLSKLRYAPLHVLMCLGDQSARRFEIGLKEEQYKALKQIQDKDGTVVSETVIRALDLYFLFRQSISMASEMHTPGK